MNTIDRILWTTTSAALLATLSLSGAGCGQVSSADPDRVGEARFALTNVPADGTCIQISVVGARSVTALFDATAGKDASFVQGGLPIGPSTFTGAAFAGGCAALSPTAMPNWLSDPVPATLSSGQVKDVALVMRRNGRARIGIDFQDDPTIMGTPPDAGAVAIDAGSLPDSGAAADAASGSSIKTVFVIVMAGHDWSEIKGNPSAPYINSTLLSVGGHAEGYRNLANLGAGEPYRIWMEAGSNFGITSNGIPASQHLSTTAHLVTQLEAAGVSWKAYVEGIPGTSCPLTSAGTYAVNRVPFVFFDDVTDHNSTTSAHCLAHLRPYTELAADVVGQAVARYNFIVPDLCHDMTGGSSSCSGPQNVIQAGDAWLSDVVGRLLLSPTYADGAAIFVTWDQSGINSASDTPIGLIALSKAAKAGYVNTVAYSSSSLLRTVQTIFGVSPFLGDAATSNDLRDLFQTFP